MLRWQSRLSWLAAIVAIAVAFTACPSPFGATATGQVVVKFGSGGGAASRAPGIPVEVNSIEISIKASDMATILVKLTTPSLSATIDVPAGAGRSFEVLAKDAGDIPVYRGKTAMDIQAGAVHELAVSMAALYALSYDANGADGGTVPSTLYLEAGVAMSIAPNSGGLTGLGYSFDGWNSLADGTGTDYVLGVAYTMGAANLALFAQWQLSTSTITYHLNGGVNDPGNPATYTVLSALITLIDPTWGANTFQGWFTDAALTVPIVSLPAGSTGNLDLYAKWNVPSFTITFDKNATLAAGSMASQTIANGSTEALLANGFTRAGYTFNGWNTMAGGTGTAYPDGELYTMGAANVTLYAQWAGLSYTVAFDAQSGTAPVPAFIPVTNGSVYGALASTSRTGYTFDGWWTLVGGGLLVTSATSVDLTVNQTLFAQWTANNYSVTFDMNGGVGGMSPQNYAFDTTAPLMSNTFTRVGYSFVGWGLAPAGPVLYANMVPFTMNVTGTTLFAQWNVNTYSVTYNANGATLGTVPGVQNDNFGATVTVSGNTGNMVGAFIQDGIRQRFVEWNTDPAGIGTAYAPGVSLVLGAANVTLYAQYTSSVTVVGKVGPAGGFVFHDKGTVTDGWRYLEVVPTSHAPVPNWSDVTATLLGGTGAGFGSGVFNTLLIISQAGHTASAASIADAYTKTYDGVVYDDWFLPSTDEINEAFTVLDAADIGAGAYWSSHEQAANSAYCPAQSNPTHAVVKNQAGYPFRSIRAFATSAETYVIQYLANGADSGSPIQDTSHYAAGQALNFGGVNDMIKSTYDFGGWNTAPDGSGTGYAPGASTMPAGNLVLYAVWNPV